MPNGTAGGSVIARADEPGSGECPARAPVRVAALAARFARQRGPLIGAAEGESLHEAVARLDHVGRAFDPLFRQQRGLQAFARGMAGVQAFDVSAAVDECEQPGCARGGDAERVGELRRPKVRAACPRP